MLKNIRNRIALRLTKSYLRSSASASDAAIKVSASLVAMAVGKANGMSLAEEERYRMDLLIMQLDSRDAARAALERLESGEDVSSIVRDMTRDAIAKAEAMNPDMTGFFAVIDQALAAADTDGWPEA